MSFKFEKLEVWRLAVEYIDVISCLAELLPRSEEYNLKAQVNRAATSIALNIAEGSTGQTNTEQARFLGLALRSLIETVACQQLIRHRRLLPDEALLDEAYAQAERLLAKLTAMRRAIAPAQSWIRDEAALYTMNDSEDTP